jgi:hypothetical protein
MTQMPSLARDRRHVGGKALAVLVRAKMKAALARRCPDLVLPKAAWSKPWVVDCAAWGDGTEAVLRYLARYLFRFAITESRIIRLDDTGVTIQHKHRASGQWRKTSLHGHEFVRRFLQHVLPKRFHKVRYSGLWHPNRRDAAARTRQLLALDPSAMAPLDPPTAEPAGVGERHSTGTASSDAAPRICPSCKGGHLVYVRKLYPSVQPSFCGGYAPQKLLLCSLALASLDLACRDHRPGVSATLTTTAYMSAELSSAPPLGLVFLCSHCNGRVCVDIHCSCDGRISLYSAAPIRLAILLNAWTITQEGRAHLLNGRLVRPSLRSRGTATYPIPAQRSERSVGTRLTVSLSHP